MNSKRWGRYRYRVILGRVFVERAELTAGSGVAARRSLGCYGDFAVKVRPCLPINTKNGGNVSVSVSGKGVAWPSSSATIAPARVRSAISFRPAIRSSTRTRFPVRIRAERRTSSLKVSRPASRRSGPQPSRSSTSTASAPTRCRCASLTVQGATLRCQSTKKEL